MLQTDKPNFASFVWAGYECLYAKVQDHRRVDQLKETKHDEYCRQDYKLIKKLGIFTAREGLSWSQIDKGNGIYDFNRFRKMMRIGQEEQVQQIWDLNHFDFPDDLDPFTQKFIKRFASYAKECIKLIKQFQIGTIYIAPINEISFFALIAADNGKWAPYVKRRGIEFKKQLVKATIAAMDAIWSVDKKVRFIHVDPIFRRIPLSPSTPTTRKKAKEFVDAKFQAWDMLSGRIFPELGGSPKYLDILGANYYYYNQEWILPKRNAEGSIHMTIPWNSKERVSLTDMIEEVYKRYGRPMVISETGGWGALRRMWWPRTFKQLNQAKTLKLPIYGVCAYPIIDRADWVAGHLTNSGLWDFKKNDQTLKRIPHEPTIRVVQKYINSLK